MANGFRITGGVLAGAWLLLGQDPDPSKEGAVDDLLAILNTVITSASRVRERASEAPAPTIVLTRSDLERRGYTQFYEILNDLPGFDLLMSYGPTFMKPYARGYRNNIGDMVLFLVDGQPLNQLWFNASYSTMAALPLSNIQQVEIVYGPASAVYGANAFMGVINVITRKFAPPGFSSDLLLSRGTLSRGGKDLTCTLSRNGWDFSATARRYEGDVDTASADQYEYSSRKYFRPELYGRLLEFFPGDGSSPYVEEALDLSLRRGTFAFRMQYLDLFSHEGHNYPSDRYLPSSGTWHQRDLVFSLQQTSKVTEALEGQTTVRYRRSDIPNDSLDFAVRWDPASKAFKAFPQHWASTNSALSLNTDFAWTLSPALVVNAGLVLTHESLERGYRLSNPGTYLIPTARFDWSLLQPPAGSDPSDAGHIGIERRGGYLQGKLGLTPGQSLILGARHDWHSFFKGASTLRLGYVGTHRNLTVKLLFGQAYQEPSHRQFFGGWLGSGSSTFLTPERSDTTEASATYTRSTWSVTADLYRIRNANTILPYTGGAQNLGSQRLLCLDLHGQALLQTVRNADLRLWAYATRIFHHLGDPYNPRINVLDAPDVGDIPRTKLWFGATALLPHQVNLTVRGRAFSERRTIGTNPVGRIPGFTTLDAYLQAGDLFWPGLSLGLRVTNVTDRDYVLPGLRDAEAGERPGGYNASGDWVGSAGVNSSKLPQAGRALEVLLRYRF